MASIQKPVARGNGRDPQPSGAGVFRYPTRQGAPPAPGDSPWDAVTCVEQIRELLDTYFGFDYFGADGFGYSVERDLEYQRLVSRVVVFLEMDPCFRGLWCPDFVAPPILGHVDRGRWQGRYDGNPGRRELVALQSEMIAALVAAGVPRPTTDRSSEPKLVPELTAADSLEVPFVVAPNAPLVDESGSNGGFERLMPGTRKRGRPRIEVSATEISETYWTMKDERIGTAEAKYDPIQQDVCDRLAAEGRRISPNTLTKILKAAEMLWPPPRPPVDGPIGDP